MNNYARTVQLIVTGLLAMVLAPPNASGGVGDYDYCTVSGPCGEGGGDCDGNSECQAGLVCVQDQGAYYPAYPSPSANYDPSIVDVCEAPNSDLCALFGPCPAGNGNCDSDSECQAGLSCVADVGAQYGYPANYDVCEAPTGSRRPDPDYCVTNYCGPGDGDCDPGQCGEGVCVNDVGAQYGLPAHYDVCEASSGSGRPDPDYCVTNYCGPGDGDCDPGQCNEGVCVNDVGAQYGLPAHYDVCEDHPGDGNIACAADTVGDTPGSAAIIVLDQTVREALECDRDIDYFVVSVPRAGILDVKTWDHEDNWIDVEYSDYICGDGHICLLDGWTWGEADGTHATTEIAAGRYYVRINDDSPIPYIGSYQLNVRLHPLQDDHGDWDVEATHVSVPSATQGIIETITPHDTQHGNYPTDVDVFEITLPEKPPEARLDFTWERQIIITIEGETLLQAKLIDVSGSVFEQTREGQSDGPIQFIHTQQGGVNTGDTLWLEVAGADHTVHNTGPYTVRISQEESATGAPGIPRNVRVAEVGADYIELRWDPPAGGGAASYNVYYRIAGGAETFLDSVSTLGVRVTGIGDTRERCYRVSAVNAEGVEGEKTESVCVRTDDGGGDQDGLHEVVCYAPDISECGEYAMRTAADAAEVARICRAQGSQVLARCPYRDGPSCIYTLDASSPVGEGSVRVWDDALSPSSFRRQCEERGGRWMSAG